MNYLIFLKVFGESCLYFACIGGLSGLFPYSFSPFWPALICSAATAIAAFISDHGKSRGRFFCLLFPVGCITFAADIMDGLILLPLIIYTILMILRDEWDMEYFHFREFFQKSLMILGIFLLVIFFGGMLEDTTAQRKPLLDSSATLKFGLIYTVIGILLQRQLRMGSDGAQGKYLSNQQMVLVSLSTGLFLLLILGAERYLASQGISLGNLIGQALRLIVGLPIYLLGFLISLLMGLDGKVLEKIESEQAPETHPSPTAPLPQMGEAILQQPQMEVGFPWWLAILILAAMTALLILLSRVLRSQPSGHPIQETITTLAPDVKAPRAFRGSNRQKLRKIYRDFLKLEKRKGRKLMTWHTSQDILEGIRPGANTEAARQLRSAYLRARYDLHSDVTPEQLQSAKEAWKQYKND